MQPRNGYEDILTAISAGLASAGMSQADFAKELGQSEKHVSRVLTGNGGVGTATLTRMLDLAGVRLVPVESVSLEGMTALELRSEIGRLRRELEAMHAERDRVRQAIRRLPWSNDYRPPRDS